MQASGAALGSFPQTTQSPPQNQAATMSAFWRCPHLVGRGGDASRSLLAQLWAISPMSPSRPLTSPPKTDKQQLQFQGFGAAPHTW